MFEVIGKTDAIETSKLTLHINERNQRAALVNRLITEEGAVIIDAYIVDKHHKNGKEIHVVYNNGCIKIYNNDTHKYITCLVARLPQITRYGIEPTKTMKKKIKKHISLGYNEIY